MNPQECFSDGTLCWGTLGETGSSQLQVAWKYGLPLGGDITVTTSPMVAVKWKLIALLPQGMLFQRKTLKRVWVWATPFVCNPHILQVDVRPNELTFSRLSGVEAATMPVTDHNPKFSGQTAGKALIFFGHIMGNDKKPKNHEDAINCSKKLCQDWTDRFDD